MLQLNPHLRGFSQANLTKLKEVIKFVEGYIGKEGVKERMKKDLLGFSRANLTELEEVIAFIEDYIGKEAVIEKIKRDLHGFSMVKLSDLKKTEKLLGKKDIKIALERYNLQNERFRITNTEGSCEDTFAIK